MSVVDVAQFAPYGSSAVFASAPRAGNHIIAVATNYGNSGGSVPSVSGLGGTWTKIADIGDSNNYVHMGVYRCTNPDGLSTTVSVTGTNVVTRVCAWEIKNANSATPTVVTHGSGLNSSSFTSAAIAATTPASDLLLIAVGTNGGTWVSRSASGGVTWTVDASLAADTMDALHARATTTNSSAITETQSPGYRYTSTAIRVTVNPNLVPIATATASNPHAVPSTLQKWQRTPATTTTTSTPIPQPQLRFAVPPATATVTGRTARPSTYPAIDVAIPTTTTTVIATNPVLALRYQIPPATATATSVQPAQGDDAVSAIVISGLTGTATVDMTVATAGANDPSRTAGDATSETFWLVYTADQPGTLEFITGPSTWDSVLEIYGGDPSDEINLQLVDSTSTGVASDLTIIAAQGVVYYIRLAPMTAGDLPADVTLTWTFTPRTADLQIRVYANLASTPDQLEIDVMNGDPDTDCNIFLFGDLTTSVATGTFDDSGVILDLNVPVPPTAAGTGYQLDAQNGAKSATATFDILGTAVADPTAIGPDAAPTAPAPDPTVTMWYLYDPAPGGVTFTFLVNPLSTTSPNIAKVYAVDKTTAFDGQVLTWEGARKPVQWSWTGTLLDQAQLDALDGFVNTNRRLYIVDHHRRAYVVSLESLDATPIRDANRQWTHQYTVNTLCYTAAVDVP